MFAVIKTGGRQYRVVPDDVLEIGKIAGDVGTIVQLGEVLLVGGESPVLGVPTVAGASGRTRRAPLCRRSHLAPPPPRGTPCRGTRDFQPVRAQKAAKSFTFGRFSPPFSLTPGVQRL